MSSSLDKHFSQLTGQKGGALLLSLPTMIQTWPVKRISTLLSDKESALQYLCEVCDSGIVSKKEAICYWSTLCGEMLVAV